MIFTLWETTNIDCLSPTIQNHDETMFLQFRAKALGTPRPNILWQKDEVSPIANDISIQILDIYEFANLGIGPQCDVQDPIFITEGIEIEEETDGSTLTVHNLQLEDQVFKMDLYLYGFLVHILFLSQ